MMPGLDGFQLLKALRGDERTTAVPVVLLSARAGEESRVEGLEAGADDYLVKPFSARELLARVQTHLELSRLRTETQESIRSRESFFSAASHELRNPIHALQMQLLSVLRKGHADGELGKEWVVERVGKAANNVARLVRLVDNLLDATRVATGRMDLELHDVDLADIVKDAVDRLEPNDRAQVHLSVVPVIGHWDRLRVDQVVTNLLSNALKYGGGEPIDLEVRASAGKAALMVRDRGVGIRPEDHARIFERFERADRRVHYEGFGLGLWISNQIVKALGGEISVTSQLGEGSTFRVVLPQNLPAS
jgi:signal transduction histidine kinase